MSYSRRCRNSKQCQFVTCQFIVFVAYWYERIMFKIADFDLEIDQINSISLEYIILQTFISWIYIRPFLIFNYLASTNHCMCSISIVVIGNRSIVHHGRKVGMLVLKWLKQCNCRTICPLICTYSSTLCLKGCPKYLTCMYLRYEGHYDCYMCLL